MISTNNVFPVFIMIKLFIYNQTGTLYCLWLTEFVASMNRLFDHSSFASTTLDRRIILLECTSLAHAGRLWRWNMANFNRVTIFPFIVKVLPNASRCQTF